MKTARARRIYKSYANRLFSAEPGNSPRRGDSIGRGGNVVERARGSLQGRLFPVAEESGIINTTAGRNMHHRTETMGGGYGGEVQGC